MTRVGTQRHREKNLLRNIKDDKVGGLCGVAGAELKMPTEF
jgi:hypothetical protein